MLRIITIVLLTLTLQACGLADRFFTTNECEGDNCEAPVLLNNENSDRKWFCYGKSQDEPWQCQNTPDETKISAVQPETRDLTQRRNTAPQLDPTSAITLPANGSAKPSGSEGTTQLQAPILEPIPAPVAPSVRLPANTSGAAQVLEAAASQYAVQLIALREFAGIEEYAGLNGIEKPLYVKIRNDDSDWFILLLGIYENKTLAETAKREWETAKVLRIQPWIRQLGGLQDAIRAAQE